MISTYKFSLDHFGVVMSPLYQRLLNQDSNKRARKVAFNSIVRIAKASRQIPSTAKVIHIGTSCNMSGEVKLMFLTEEVKLDEHKQSDGIA